jgi:fatty acid desaturase
VIVTALVAVSIATRLPWVAAATIDIIAFCVIGWSQYSLGNGMHEAVHHNLRNKKSDFLAALLTAYPIGLTVAYRDVHLRHHRHLGTHEDPELSVYTTFPQSKGALIRRFLWNVSGIPAASQFLQQRRDATFAGGKPDYAEPIKFLLVQLVIVSTFWFVFGSIVFYVVFWILPIMTVGKLLSTTRLLCEHGSPNRDWVVRTIVASRWQTWLMGAFDFNFHGEHHLFPSVPYAQLQSLHLRHRSYIAQHAEYRPFGGRFEIFDGGYLALLVHWFRILPWAADRRDGR